MPFKKAKKIASAEFFTLGVDFQRYPKETKEMLKELNVKSVLFRIKLWEMQEVQELKNFLDDLPQDIKITLKIMQDREHIEDLELLKQDLYTIFKAFCNRVDIFEIGTTINRTKWGFFSVDEYLKFYEVAGPTVALNGYFKVEGVLKKDSSDTGIENYIDLSSGIQATVGGKIEILSKELGRIDYVLYDKVFWSKRIEPGLFQTITPEFTYSRNDDGELLVAISGAYGADIYYTMDGSEPSENVSPKYTSEILVKEGGITISARAYKELRTPSKVNNQEINFLPPVVISPEGREFIGTDIIKMSCNSSRADIYYTTSNQFPTPEVGKKYSGPIMIDDSKTIRATSYPKYSQDEDKWFSPPDTRERYWKLVMAPRPVIEPMPTLDEKYTGEVEVKLSVEREDLFDIYYTLDGSMPNPPDHGILYSGPFTISENTTLKTVSYRENFEPGLVKSAVYHIKCYPAEANFENNSVVLTCVPI
jgi:hypothetical protein